MGLPEFDKITDKYYNSQVIIAPDGKVIEKYRKIHLYGSDLDWATKGNLGFKVTETKPGKIGLGICYDINFSELFDFFPKSNIDIFAFSTNWIGETPTLFHIGQTFLKIKIYILSLQITGVMTNSTLQEEV